MNKEWHLAHPMPKNPSLDQRIQWHLEHAKECSCRKMPASVIEALKQRKKKN